MESQGIHKWLTVGTLLVCLLMSLCACMYVSGWEGGQSRCAARLAVHEWCGHSPVCQRCVRAAIALGTLLPMGLLWRETVPEQASARHTGQGGPAGHVWGTGTYTYAHIKWKFWYMDKVFIHKLAQAQGRHSGTVVGIRHVMLFSIETCWKNELLSV